jgi:hypothetical protein
VEVAVEVAVGVAVGVGVAVAVGVGVGVGVARYRVGLVGNHVPPSASLVIAIALMRSCTGCWVARWSARSLSAG